MILELNSEQNRNSNWLADQTKQLLLDQKKSWPLLRKNYESLSAVQTRTYEAGGVLVAVQFNPERIKSSSADVSDKAINGRKCFLCLENLPEEQNGLAVNNFILLCNPYPIFAEHFTIVNRNHQPQRINNSFEELLHLSSYLGKNYTVFYNGPRCGASAPDHLHFQAVTKNVMPLERDFDSISSHHTSAAYGNENIKIDVIEDGLRRFISFESKDKQALGSAFSIFSNTLEEVYPSEDEPMMNIIVSFDQGVWRILLFPRKAHRPQQFFAEGEAKLLVSPAAVDLCGLIITPRKEDFEKITREDIVDIFKQITITKENFDFLRKKLEEAFTS